MQTLIIDNEPKVVKALEKMIHRHCPDLELMGIASGVKDGLQKIHRLKPDLVFLDVEMNDGTGLDLLARLPDRSFELIFISAYNHYALHAFRCSAIDFLPKPIDPLDLIRAVQKAKEASSRSEAQERLKVLLDNMQSHHIQKIVLRDVDNFYIIAISEIVHCRAEGSYTRFFLQDERQILVSKNLREYEKILGVTGFFRSHHSHLVQLDQVVRVNKSDSTLILRNGTELPVSTRKKDQLISRLTRV